MQTNINCDGQTLLKRFPPSKLEKDRKNFTELLLRLKTDKRFLNLSISGQKKFESYLKSVSGVEEELEQFKTSKATLATMLAQCLRDVNVCLLASKHDSSQSQAVLDLSYLLICSRYTYSITFLKYTLVAFNFKLDGSDYGKTSVDELEKLIHEVMVLNNGILDSVREDVKVFFDAATEIQESCWAVMWKLQIEECKSVILKTLIASIAVCIVLVKMYIHS